MSTMCALLPMMLFYVPNPQLTTGFSLVFINLWLILLLLNIRNWSIWYKSHWTYNTVQLEWQQMINPNIKNKKNWFIDNNKKYGNINWFAKRFFILHCVGFIFTIIGVSIRILNSKGYDLILTILSISIIVGSLLIPIIFYVIILWNTPTFHSSYVFIHWESQLQSKLLILSIIVLLFCQISSQFTTIYISIPIVCLSNSYIFFAMNYVSTYALIRKNRTPIIQDAKQVDITLNQTLSNKQAVHLFMVYLTTEFSIELLLSFIEFTQFEKYVLNLIQNDLPSKELLRFHSEAVIKHSNVPQSNILEHQPSLKNEDTILNDAKVKAQKLYDKYVRTGSEFEINLPSWMRKKITNKLGDNYVQLTDLSDLLILFQKAKVEMKKYLGYSYTRFKQQKEFQQIIQLFVDSKDIWKIAKKKNSGVDVKQIKIDIPTDNKHDDVDVVIDEESSSNSTDEHKPKLDLHTLSAKLQTVMTRSTPPDGYVEMASHNRN
eukprot:222597_1